MQYFQAKMFDGTVDTEMRVCLAAQWEQSRVVTRHQITVINAFNNARSTLRGRVKTLPGMRP